MSTKFAIIGVVSVLGVGAAMHHARFCPLQKMMAAMHHQHAPVTASVHAPAPASAKVAATEKVAAAEKAATASVAVNR